jgi:recombination protein RecA
MAKKRTEGVDGAGADTLAKTLAENLDKIGVNTFTLGQEESPTDLKDFIGTGSSLLDLAISNRPNGGVPVGRIVELSGMEGSGKSLIAAHLMANVQKDGGVAVFIDTETAVNEEFWTAVGVDMDKMVYVHENCLEKVFEAIEKIVERVRASLSNDKKVIIVVDSVAQLSTKAELEGGFAKEGYGTEKAFLISKAMRKITAMLGKQKILLVFTNQLRYNLQPMSHEKYITPGGKAIPFAASLRIRLSQVGKIKKGEDAIVGVKVQAKIIKNRFGPPHREVVFDVYFDRGIDDMASWIDFMKKHKIIDGGAGGYYTFVDSDGVEHKFRSSAWKEFIEKNPQQFKEMYERICQTLIMLYKSDDISTLDGSASVENTNEGD